TPRTLGRHSITLSHKGPPADHPVLQSPSLGSSLGEGGGGTPPGGVGRGWVSGGHFGLVTGPEGVERAFPVHAAVGVRAEIVALALGQRGGQAVGAQGVVVG